MSDVTRILSQIESGDPSAAEQLLPLVYDELRKLAAAKLAQEKPGQTLQATALVHEAYLRLVDGETGAALEQPRAFLCRGGRGDAADSGRAGPAQEGSQSGGGDRQRVELDDMPASRLRLRPMNYPGLDEALTGTRPATIPQRPKLVKLRYFAGLSVDEAAEALGISARNCRSPLDLCPGLAATARSAMPTESAETMTRIFELVRESVDVLEFRTVLAGEHMRIEPS